VGAAGFAAREVVPAAGLASVPTTVPDVLFGALGGGGLAGAGRAVVAVVLAGALDAVADVLIVLAVVLAVLVLAVVAEPFGREPAEAAPVEVPTCPFARLSVVGFESAWAGPSLPGR